jgi:drug/metabolite transporter (DMT)-like permease
LTPFWVSILGYFINGEKVRLVEMIAMAICLGFVIALTLMKGNKNAEQIEDVTASDGMVTGVIVCIIASWFNASESICSRRLNNVHFTLVMYYNAVVGTLLPFVVLVVYSLVTHEEFFPVSGLGWMW